MTATATAVQVPVLLVLPLRLWSSPAVASTGLHGEVPEKLVSGFLGFAKHMTGIFTRADRQGSAVGCLDDFDVVRSAVQTGLHLTRTCALRPRCRRGAATRYRCEAVRRDRGVLGYFRSLFKGSAFAHGVEHNVPLCRRFDVYLAAGPRVFDQKFTGPYVVHFGRPKFVRHILDECIDRVSVYGADFNRCASLNY